MDVPQLRNVAVHEAAHAVIARVLGIRAYDVNIIGNDALLGAASFDNPRYEWRRGDGSKVEAANKFAMAAYAGLEAEVLICGNHISGDSDDVGQAEDCLAWAGAVRGASFVGDEHFEQHEKKLRKRVRSLIAAHRVRIQAVANELMAKRCLTALEVDVLMTE